MGFSEHDFHEMQSGIREIREGIHKLMSAHPAAGTGMDPTIIDRIDRRFDLAQEQSWRQFRLLLGAMGAALVIVLGGLSGGYLILDSGLDGLKTEMGRLSSAIDGLAKKLPAQPGDSSR